MSKAKSNNNNWPNSEKLYNINKVMLSILLNPARIVLLQEMLITTLIPALNSNLILACNSTKQAILDLTVVKSTSVHN